MTRGTERGDRPVDADAALEEATVVDHLGGRQQMDSVSDEVTVRLPPDEMANAVATGVACEPPLYSELTPISAEEEMPWQARREPTSYRSALMDAVSSDVTTQPNFDKRVREFASQRRRNVKRTEKTQVDTLRARLSRNSEVRDSRPDESRSLIFSAMVPIFIGLALGIAGFMWGLARGRASVDSTAVAASALAASASTRPALALSAEGEGTELERAVLGDAQGINALEARPAAELSARELLALEAGRRNRKERQLWALSTERPGRLNEDTQLALIEHAKDVRLAPAVLAAFAELEGPTGPDLLYQVASTDSLPQVTRDLARRALRARDVRQKASPALGVLLDLMNARTCSEKARVLPRAVEHADTRALALLRPLTRMSRGCGARGTEDCHECLRGSSELLVAIRAARKRRAPRLSSRQ